MNMKQFFLVLIPIAALAGCAGGREKEMTIGQRVAGLLGVKAMRDHIYPEITGDERQRQRDLYNGIVFKNMEKIRGCLASGADPDKCLGIGGWVENNPLHMVVRSTTITHRGYKDTNEETPVMDVPMMNLLLEAGADINRWPYIWAIVLHSDNDYLNRLKAQPEEIVNGVQHTTPEEAAAEAESFVKDHNRVLRAFLAAGADPDKPGHEYPLRPDRKDWYMTDEEAEAYFAKGSRAINEVIRKGMNWESQVDILLEYTKLDEASLEAARESGDTGMVEKIEELWRKQQR